MNIYRDTMSYIHNRWVCPSDRVVIRHPDYPRGHYYDADGKMLYILFQMLVDFVEIECAIFPPNSNYFETRQQRIYRIIQDLPVLTWLLPSTRNARRGLYHLRWAMKLKDMPGQAEHAKAVFKLYRFWKHERPARKDPFAAYSAAREGKEWRGSLTPKEKKLLDRGTKLEDKYEREDEKMLHLLMKIRMGLWT